MFTGFAILKFCAVDEGRITVSNEAEVNSTGGLPSEVTLGQRRCCYSQAQLDVEDGFVQRHTSDSGDRGTTPGPHLCPLRGIPGSAQSRAERREIDGKMLAVRVDPKIATF